MVDESTETDFQQVQDVEIVGGKDWFLQSMIETVINGGVEIGITLIVGGSIVSGILISGQKYFDELGDSLTKASQAEGDIQSILGEAWRGYKAIYEKPEGASDSWQPPSASFIHLRDARFHAPGQKPLPTNRGILWRGRISAIAGWSVGNFSVVIRWRLIGLVLTATSVRLSPMNAMTCAPATSSCRARFTGNSLWSKLHTDA